MRYPKFPITPGDKFHVPAWGVVISFEGMADENTAFFLINGFIQPILVMNFMTAYVDGHYQEVPGAGDIREVVP